MLLAKLLSIFINKIIYINAISWVSVPSHKKIIIYAIFVTNILFGQVDESNYKATLEE